jgi:hypothetical protein
MAISEPNSSDGTKSPYSQQYGPKAVGEIGQKDPSLSSKKHKGNAPIKKHKEKVFIKPLVRYMPKGFSSYYFCHNCIHIYKPSWSEP